MKAFLLVGLGGGIGSMLRFGLGLLLPRASATAFPWSTLLVNIVGSLAIGFLARQYSAPGGDATMPLFLMVGVCGGFTTFSAFSLETLMLLRAGATSMAATYVIASVTLSLAAAFAGARASS